MRYPKVSVILPVRNEKERIVECLGEIFAQSYPKGCLEVLVVDGGSEDGTKEAIERALKGGEPFVSVNAADRKERPSVRILENPKGQRASGLNIGIKAAGGDVIMRIDARSSIPCNYIERCVETLIETGADNVGGVQKPIARSVTQEAIGSVLSHPFGVGNAAFRLGKRSGYVDTVYLGCFRRDVFDKVGLFDEEAPVISEDSDINQRIREAGGKVYLNSQIHAYYDPRETFKDFWRISFRYGGARAGNLLKHGRLTSWRQMVPPVFVLCLVVFAALSLVERRFLLPLVGVLGLYSITDAAISLVLSVQRRKGRLFPKLFVAFPCMHFGWGLGFWKRLLVRVRPGNYWAS